MLRLVYNLFPDEYTLGSDRCRRENDRLLRPDLFGGDSNAVYLAGDAVGSSAPYLALRQLTPVHGHQQCQYNYLTLSTGAKIQHSRFSTDEYSYCRHKGTCLHGS